ncbi:MAG TPA: ferredoxin reductase family protein [Methylophilaceae bacterium]|jgi:predicted ferric reductase
MQLKSWQPVVTITVISFALTLAEVPSKDIFTTAAFSLAAGAAALSLMATAAMLGARWTWVETCFGGLDRVYQAHKWLGIWALVLASFHFLFKAGIREWEVASIISLAPDVTRLVRQSSYVALVFIIMLALNRNIPYNVWRWWHKLSGPLFLIVILHWLSFKSPIALDSPAGIWLATVSTLGIVAAVYKLLLYRFFSSHAEYEVVGINRGAGAVHMQLAPVGRAIDFEAGQFGFLRMKAEGLREPHPFTIASARNADGRVDFLIRSLGDYTEKLVANTQIGMRADIYAPYGRFKRSRTARREVWIGGGVGISPFVAWLKDEANHFDRVTLFYFYTPGRDFPGVDTLREMAQQRGAELVPVADGPASPVFLARFAEIVKEAGPGAIEVSFCGPKGLLARVRTQLREHGIPEANLRYEFFNFR